MRGEHQGSKEGERALGQASGLAVLGIITRVMPCREELNLEIRPHVHVSVPKSRLVGKVYTSAQSLKSIRIVCVHSDGRVMAWFYN